MNFTNAKKKQQKVINTFDICTLEINLNWLYLFLSDIEMIKEDIVGLKVNMSEVDASLTKQINAVENQLTSDVKGIGLEIEDLKVSVTVVDGKVDSVDTTLTKRIDGVESELESSAETERLFARNFARLARKFDRSTKLELEIARKNIARKRLELDIARKKFCSNSLARNMSCSFLLGFAR